MWNDKLNEKLRANKQGEQKEKKKLKKQDGYWIFSYFPHRDKPYAFVEKCDMRFENFHIFHEKVFFFIKISVKNERPSNLPNAQKEQSFIIVESFSHIILKRAKPQQ